VPLENDYGSSNNNSRLLRQLPLRSLGDTNDSCVSVLLQNPKANRTNIRSRAEQLVKEYIVTWRIEIYAEDKNHAALQAREIQLDPNSIATIFEVAEDIEINKEYQCT
jgi:hypothetical protein